MSLCAQHRQNSVLYCEVCSEFLCGSCIDTKCHVDHANRFCSMKESVALLRAQSDSSVRRLHDMRAQTELSIAKHDTVQRALNVEGQERELLDLFSTMERVLSALKEECMRKFWTFKRQAQTQLNRELTQQRLQLRQMDRATHLLQRCVDDRECTAQELHKQFKSAAKLIDVITQHGDQDAACRQDGEVGEADGQNWDTGGTRGRAASDVPLLSSLDRTRDSLVREFFNSLHKQITASRLGPWLPTTEDMGIFLLAYLFY